MMLAYADPPYLGQGQRHYKQHHAEAGVWDTEAGHIALIERLTAGYPDGWALSCSSPSLQVILRNCPTDVRIAAWCKSFGAFKRGVRPAYMWEPVIYRGGRNPGFGYAHPPPVKGGTQTTPKDFLVCPITLKKGLTGAKPEKFCGWVLDLLNVQPGDVVVDLFPGTGAMSRVATVRTQRASST